MKGTTVYLPPNYTNAVDSVKRERRDGSRSHTARILISEALEARGVKVEEG